MNTEGKIGNSKAVRIRSEKSGSQIEAATIYEAFLATLRANGYSTLKQPSRPVQPTASQLMYWQIMNDKTDVRPIRLEDMETLLRPSGTRKAKA